MEKYVLKDLISVKRGMSLSGEYYSTEGDLIRLTLGNFQEEGGFKINTSKDDLYFTGPVKDEFILAEGDIITPLTEQVVGLLGATARIPESGKYIQSGDVALIKCISDKIDDGYCYYLISSDVVRKQLSAAAQQTKIRHTSPEKIMDCEVFIPEVKEQRKVAKLLDGINKKIELNNKINDNLHHAASDIFDYYFLQYDFPDHTGNPYRSNNGSFVYCETLKREIPSGFMVCCVDDFCNIFTGKKDVNQSFDSGKYRFYSCAPSYKYSDDKLYEGPAILISGNGSYTGRTIYVDTAFDLYQRTYACTNKDNTDRDMLIYLYYSLLRFLVPQISGGTHGSAIPYIVRDDIAKLPILYNNEAVSLFIKRVKPMLADITRIEEENITLTKLRNNLLPLLMSGQATIAD